LLHLIKETPNIISEMRSATISRCPHSLRNHNLCAVPVRHMGCVYKYGRVDIWSLQ